MPQIPEYIPISPITVVCPKCKAQPGKPCGFSPISNLEVLHVQRIAAAAKLDEKAKKAIKLRPKL